MSTMARLLGFAAALAVLFVLGLVLGTAMGPLR